MIAWKVLQKGALVMLVCLVNAFRDRMTEDDIVGTHYLPLSLMCSTGEFGDYQFQSKHLVSLAISCFFNLLFYLVVDDTNLLVTQNCPLFTVLPLNQWFYWSIC